MLCNFGPSSPQLYLKNELRVQVREYTKQLHAQLNKINERDNRVSPCGHDIVSLRETEGIKMAKEVKQKLHFYNTFGHEKAENSVHSFDNTS